MAELSLYDFEELPSDRMRNGRYFNPHYERLPRGLVHHLLWAVGYYKDKTVLPEVPADFVYPNPQEVIDLDRPLVSWINHSTYLVEIDGVTILTDPVWGERCSPFKRFGPKRESETPHAVDGLGKVDYVLISHNHYDHLCDSTVRELHTLFPEIRWIVAKGLKPWFAKRGITNVVDLDWWETHRAGIEGPDLTFHAVPSQHYSGRSLLDFNKTLWCGFVVRVRRPLGGTKVFYFVGDTGYNPYDFKEIGGRFGQIDLSLVPIGVYRPERFMSPVHIGPEEAVQIHQDVGSTLSVGGHFGTFNLSAESHQQPPYDLYLAMQDQNLAHETFRVLDPGQKINW